jgi:hypothetical protein
MGLGSWVKKGAKRVGGGAKKAAKSVGRGAKAVGRGAKRAGATALDATDTVLRAPGRALHGVPVVGRIADSIPSIRDPLAPVFESVVATNLTKAERLPVPGEHAELVRSYIEANGDDGAWLSRGLRAKPRFHHGGWILKTQPGASAMTLDNDVFVRDGDLPIRRYVHELVHVGQYKVLGRTQFLTSYFGLSAATIAYRWIRRKPTVPMESSPHEKSAYAIDDRFCNWVSSQTTSSGQRVTCS